MYCEVAIPLKTVSDAVVIPRSALQPNNQLYRIVESTLTKKGILKIIEDIEVIHEGREGLIVQLPMYYGALKLVNQQLKPAESF